MNPFNAACLFSGFPGKRAFLFLQQFRIKQKTQRKSQSGTFRNSRFSYERSELKINHIYERIKPAVEGCSKSVLFEYHNFLFWGKKEHAETHMYTHPQSELVVYTHTQPATQRLTHQLMFLHVRMALYVYQ